VLWRDVVWSITSLANPEVRAARASPDDHFRPERRGDVQTFRGHKKGGQHRAICVHELLDGIREAT